MESHTEVRLKELTRSTPAAIAASKHSAYGATAKKRPKIRREPPAVFGNDALIDIEVCAAGGGVSLSWWHEKVRTGEAPEPAIRAPRFTRWNLGQVRQFWTDYVAKAAQEAQAADSVKDRAAKASAAAKAARQAHAK